MTLYLDTSVLIAALTHEPKTSSVLQWLGAQGEEELAISDWVITEFSSALSIKLRTGQIALAARAGALAAFAELCVDSLTVLPISGHHFRTAARFADQHPTALRGGDALHAAVCADYGTALCTLDQRLAASGPTFGVPTIGL